LELAISSYFLITINERLGCTARLRSANVPEPLMARMMGQNAADHSASRLFGRPHTRRGHNELYAAVIEATAGLCHGNERRIERGQGLIRCHAAATASNHCAAASALKIRSVEMALMVERIVDGGIYA
jgi:hypothetical protein